MAPPIQQDNEIKKENSLFGSVIESLGGVVFAIESIDKALGFIGKFHKNKFYQKSIQVVRGVAPAIITGQRIYTSVKEFKENKKQQYARQKKAVNILRFMKQEHLDEYDLESYDFNIGREIISWLMSRSKTEIFKIVEFYNAQFQPIPSKSFDRGELYILIEFNNNKYMIECDISLMNQQVFVSSCKIHTTTSMEKIYELRTSIFSEFIKYFDTVDNVIEMDAKGLHTRKRIGFDYNIYQFDVDAFKKEIKKAIDKQKKRSYVLVGPPGVGKSTIIVKLEKELSEIPIIYISSSAMVFREDVLNVFNFLRSISPCIAVLEDLDGCELRHKHDRIFGEFIEQIDSLKHKECVITISTVNEPEMIHESLINRRGRSDKVFFIDYPKTKNEILDILKNKVMKENCKDYNIKNFPQSVFNKIIKNKFSHADICEVIESLIINDIPITNESISQGVNEVIRTMRAVKKCKSNKKDEDEFIPEQPVEV